MSIASIITQGYGSYSDVNKLPTLGYSTVLVTQDNVNPKHKWALDSRDKFWILTKRKHWNV